MQCILIIINYIYLDFIPLAVGLLIPYYTKRLF
jgi:hypothetical protein